MELYKTPTRYEESQKLMQIARINIYLDLDGSTSILLTLLRIFSMDSPFPV